MEALIQHFLIYSQGFTVPAGDAYVPIEGPRGEHGFYIVSDGTNRPWRIKARPPSFMAIQALPQLIVGGLIADVIAVIGSTDVGDGRLRPMSFHPQMAYGSGWPQVGAELAEAGEPFAYTPENQAKFRRNRRALSGRPAQVGDDLPRCTWRRSSRGYITGNAMRHVAEHDRLHGSGRGGRGLVLHRCSSRSRSANTCCTSAARCRARCSAPSASPRS